MIFLQPLCLVLLATSLWDQRKAERAYHIFAKTPTNLTKPKQTHTQPKKRGMQKEQIHKPLPQPPSKKKKKRQQQNNQPKT